VALYTVANDAAVGTYTSDSSFTTALTGYQTATLQEQNAYGTWESFDYYHWDNTVLGGSSGAHTKESITVNVEYFADAGFIPEKTVMVSITKKVDTIPYKNPADLDTELTAFGISDLPFPDSSGNATATILEGADYHGASINTLQGADGPYAVLEYQRYNLTDAQLSEYTTALTGYLTGKSFTGQDAFWLWSGELEETPGESSTRKKAFVTAEIYTQDATQAAEWGDLPLISVKITRTFYDKADPTQQELTVALDAFGYGAMPLPDGTLVREASYILDYAVNLVIKDVSYDDSDILSEYITKGIKAYLDASVFPGTAYNTANATVVQPGTQWRMNISQDMNGYYLPCGFMLITYDPAYDDDNDSETPETTAIQIYVEKITPVPSQ
jgi:hypothetical protein